MRWLAVSVALLGLSCAGSPRAAGPGTPPWNEESPLGNLVTDAIRARVPEADLAVTNSGGLRADLPAGPLTYGHVFAAIPLRGSRPAPPAGVGHGEVPRPAGGRLIVTGAEPACPPGR